MILGILEPITVLHTNRNENSEIYTTFRELHSEKNIQRITFRELQRVIFRGLNSENYRELLRIIDHYQKITFTEHHSE